MVKRTFLDTAYEILRSENRPLSAREITVKGLESGLTSTKGKTPEMTMGALLYCDIRDNGHNSKFTKLGPGLFGLAGWGKSQDAKIADYWQHQKQLPRKGQRFDKSGFTDVSDHTLLRQLKNEIRQIRTYLKGLSDSIYSHENICFWVWLCYKFEMYREGAMLFRRISQDNIEKDLYKITEKIALACEGKLRK